MTLTVLLFRIALIAALLTGLNFALKKVKGEWAEIKNWILTYLQNFCGALFVFSGYVKAIDPKGTAYKTEQYFGEFETHFFDFLTPMFQLLADYALAFSLFTIILEIVLGVMLIIGYRRKLTAWLFLGIIIFFTFLTGFTYLTGYVPEGVNFFSVGSWGEYDKNNMKVTDCGCFGDFIKLEPKVSFFKDLALLVPGFLFLFLYAKKHVLFTKKIRIIILAITTIVVTLFCFRNTFWGLPMQDFRPFKEGVNVREVKIEEEEKAGNAKVDYQIRNKNTNETQILSMDAYIAKFSEPDFKTNWETVKQIREDVKTTKISEFSMTDLDGNDIGQQLLDYDGYHLMAVSYKMKYDESHEKIMRKDTTFRIDTVAVEGIPDSFNLVQNVDDITEKEYVVTKYKWHDSYKKDFEDKVNPLFNAAEKAGVKTYAVTKPYAAAQIDEFRHEVQAAYPFFTADDILLKTIIRSNPGVVLWKDGAIIKKWHISDLPDFDEVKAKYIK